MQFTAQASMALRHAMRVAKVCGQGYIGSEHLLIGLLRARNGMASAILTEHKVSDGRVKALIHDLIVPDGVTQQTGELRYSPRAETILAQAENEAAFFRQEEVGTEHILLALLKDPECAAMRLLHTMGVPVQKVFAEVLESLGMEEQQFREYAQQVQNGFSMPLDMLERFSRNLTQQAAEGRLDPVVGREEEIRRIVQILGRRTKNNPCLVGEPGVGKTAIVEGLAQRIVSGDVPEVMRDKQIFVLDMPAMVAGTKYRGEFEERIKKVIEEVCARRDVLLFIDELHTIIGAGGAEGTTDASNILKPALSRGEMQLIGATTADEYRKYIEKDPALERRFQAVSVEEPSPEATVSILRGLRPAYEQHHGVKISDEAIEAAVQYAARYISDRYLPDKAIDLIDEAASSKQILISADTDEIENLQCYLEDLAARKEQAVIDRDWEKASQINQEQGETIRALEAERRRQERRKKPANREVTEPDIAQVVSMWTKIPVQKLEVKESARLRKLEQTLHKQVIGQDEAVTAVSRAVKRGRVGLKDPARPIGSFLFLGPTGVGKTELSKVLAEVVFGSRQSMIRVDMSEYMEKHSVSRLVGSPPGYVGYGEGGQLSEKVRKHPYSVILFDEVEKAHPDVFNILLQVLDDGHITDAQGRKVDFKNTIIIMTSNAGAQSIIEPKKLGFAAVEDEKENYQRMKNGVMEEVRRLFKPEFLNRIDEIIVFRALNKDEVGQIAGLLLADFAKRCKEQMDITLKFQPSVKKHIAQAGFDAKYGARPLKRAIQTQVEDALAEEILSGRVLPGREVLVRMAGKQIQFVQK